MRCALPGTLPIQRAYAPTSNFTMPTSSSLDGRNSARLELPRDGADARATGEHGAQSDDPGRGSQRHLRAVPEVFEKAEQAGGRHDGHAVLFGQRTAKILDQAKGAA